ncbi:type II secretion system protein [Pseudoduganella sp. GCM10020061]|uniref:type II secretion system protein n=1 Tax=Pseudoduganella sp. GCM10020061 TaxID=3317345 RepID=UPI003627F817
MRARQGGFTYLGLIVLLTIIGLVGAATLKVESLMRRAEAEEELLEIGAEFTKALRSYAAATPRGQRQQPASLQDLVRDPRFPYPRRHLRKIYIDPITGKDEWGILYLAGQTGVIGVHSLSDTKPLKIANFDARFQNFEKAELISDWRFTMSGQGAVPNRQPQGVQPPLAPPPPGREPLPPPRKETPLLPPGVPPPPDDDITIVTPPPPREEASNER